MSSPQRAPSLERSIGLTALVLYGVGDILGSGVYGLIGTAAGELGSAVWIAFAVSMIAAGLTGLSYASLGSRYPQAGGAAYVTYRAFRSGFLSYIVGFALLASGLTSMATAARVFAGYFSGFDFGIPPLATAVLFSVLTAVLVFRGIRESLFANGLFTFIEVGGLLLIIVLGSRFLGQVDYLNATTSAHPSGQLSLPLILSGAVLTFYSFVGFEDMLNVAEEVKNPRRNMPLGLLLSLFIASLIYILVSLVAVSVVPASELAASHEPLVEVVRRAAPWFPTPVFSVVALFAVANTALLNFVMASRLLYGMSRAGLAPRGLHHVHAGRKTPHRAILIIWALFVTLILTGDISSLAKATSVLLLSCFIAVNLALIVLKRREEAEGAFEIPSLIPLLGMVVCSALLLKAQASELLTAGLILIVILVLYFVMRPQPEAIRSMDEISD